jgi:hypothetical protein
MAFEKAYDLKKNNELYQSAIKDARNHGAQYSLDIYKQLKSDL